MQINRVEDTKTPSELGDLEAGTVFRYPKGKTIYQVNEPVGNLTGLYTTGVKSGKQKVWATNLANGNISAVDFDTKVFTCTAAIEYAEN